MLAPGCSFAAAPWHDSYVLAVLLIAGLVILIAVVLVAAGRGGELPPERNDYAPLDLGPVTATDVALLRPPANGWGYNMQATDEALARVAESIRERDVRIVALEQLVTDLSREPAPPPLSSPYIGARRRRELPQSVQPAEGIQPAQATQPADATEPGEADGPARAAEPDQAKWQAAPAWPEATGSQERERAAGPGQAAPAWPEAAGSQKPAGVAEPAGAGEPEQTAPAWPEATAAREQSEAGEPEQAKWPATQTWPQASEPAERTRSDEAAPGAAGTTGSPGSPGTRGAPGQSGQPGPPERSHG